MSNRSWMEDDENDYEITSCVDTCGKLFRCTYKTEPPLVVPDRVAEEGLNADHFDLHQTFRHGLPHQPSCLAYDSVQQLLAIGSHQGDITVIGKAGLEKHLKQSGEVAIKQMLFVEDQGLLVTRCSNNTLYQWNIRDKYPKVARTLEINKYQKPTCLSWSKSTPSRIYVGMDSGNVHQLSADTLQRTDHSVFKDKVMDCIKPELDIGEVVDLSMHPSEPTKLLVGYEQMVIVWNLEKKCVDKKYRYVEEFSPVVTSLSWKGDQNHFAVSYSNGSVLTYSCRQKAQEKPKKKVVPHNGNPHSISPCEQVKYFNKNGDSWLLFSGGYPEGKTLGVRSLTIYYEKNSGLATPQLLSFADPITSFLSLSPTPLDMDKNSLGALAVLTSKDLFVHDLLAPEVPLFQLPHALDFNISPVTCVQLCGNCPDDFMAKLQSYRSKMKDESFATRPWPLMGGRWGQESPDSWSDLVVTGHMDGSVRLWYCQSVQMQFLFTINTSNYFKQRQRRDRSSTAPALSPNSTTSSHLSLLEDNCYFAIHTIEMDVHAQSLCVVNGGGRVLTLDFIKRPPCFTGRGSPMKTNSLPVDFSCDSLIITETTLELSLSSVPLSRDLWHFRPDSPQGGSVFYLLQHCQCFYTERNQKLPVVVTAVRYSSETDLLVIGSNRGLALINTATSSCVKMLNHRTTLFYIADPANYQRELSQMRISKKPNIDQMSTGVRVRHTLPSIGDSQFVEEYQKVHSLREQFFPLLQNALPSAITSSSFYSSVMESTKQLCITCLGLVQLTLSREKVPMLTLWVGTMCGHVVAYNIVAMEDISLQATGIVRNQRSSVVSLFFLNDRGEQLLTPFMRRNEFSAKDGRHKSLLFPRQNKAAVYQSQSSYVIITTRHRIESIAFPNCRDIGHNEPYMGIGKMVHSGFFCCKSLPCLLNLTSTGDILIHSLPKVQHLITVPYAPLQDSRALHTFQVSGDGQALHFISPSEVQRLSVTSSDHLNLPHCLPELYEPSQKKGIYSDLKKGFVERGDRMRLVAKQSHELASTANKHVDMSRQLLEKQMKKH